MERWTARCAVAGLVALGGLVFYLVAGPVLDNDVWWHLAHGRAYLISGPWLDADPCLGTAERGPIPHSWAFDAAASAIEQTTGLQGLRAVHALICLGIGWLAFALARRESGAIAPAALGVGVFAVLTWYRLVQVRPEVLSIAFTLLLQRLLLVPTLPSWRQVAVAAALVAVWANVHALFLIGPLLLLAALGGLGVKLLAARAFRLDPGDDARRALRLGVALLVALVASLANPRGIGQHLAYLEASGAGAIQFVSDEWARFDPLGHTNAAPAVSALGWVLTDALLLAFAIVAVHALVGFLRAPSRERLEDADPLRLALGLAGCVALVTAIRFLWLGWFPLLFLAYRLRRSRRARGDAFGPADLTCVAALVLLTLCFPLLGGFQDVASHYPKRPSDWLRQAHTEDRFFAAGVRFLKASGVRGQVFNDYALGGYLCHQTGPGLRTFVDGSMNFPEEVSVDYRNAAMARGTLPGESLSAALDRRGVDLFFGFGVPAEEGHAYSTTALAGHPDWRLVSRSWRHGVYLRVGPRNAENLERVAQWYARQDVPFDRERGLDPGRVLSERPDWADAWQMLPREWFALLARDRSSEVASLVRELETVGLAYALVGAWPEQVRNDRRAAALRPRAKAPRRRLVYGLLRMGRVRPALVVARELVALDPGDARSAVFAEVARRVDTAPSIDARIRAIDGLPLLTSRQPLRQ